MRHVRRRLPPWILVNNLYYLAQNLVRVRAREQRGRPRRQPFRVAHRTNAVLKHLDHRAVDGEAIPERPGGGPPKAPPRAGGPGPPGDAVDAVPPVGGNGIFAPGGEPHFPAV